MVRPQGFAPDPYRPAGPPQMPVAVMWYRVYATVMALLYIACALGGVALAAFGDQLAAIEPTRSPNELKDEALVLVIVGLPLALVFIGSFFVPVQPWGWICHIVLIGLGLPICCCTPFSLPLLLAWLKPDVQAYFGRNSYPPGNPPHYPMGGPSSNGHGPPPIPRV